METSDSADAHMDPVLRETWDVLMSDGDFPAPTGTAAEAEASQEDKVVRSKPQLWPHAMHQQQQQQQPPPQQPADHQHQHHHQHQQPLARHVTSTPCEASAELLEEQEQQLEHTTSRAFQAVVTSPHVAEEAFPPNVSPQFTCFPINNGENQAYAQLGRFAIRSMK